MKLQKQSSRKIGDVEYPKWVVVIPPETIKNTGWREGTELDADFKDGKLIIKKK